MSEDFFGTLKKLGSGVYDAVLMNAFPSDDQPSTRLALLVIGDEDPIEINEEDFDQLLSHAPSLVDGQTVFCQVEILEDGSFLIRSRSEL